MGGHRGSEDRAFLVHLSQPHKGAALELSPEELINVFNLHLLSVQEWAGHGEHDGGGQLTGLMETLSKRGLQAFSSVSGSESGEDIVLQS